MEKELKKNTLRDCLKDFIELNALEIDLPEVQV